MKKVLSTKTLDPGALAYARTRNLEVQCLDFIETTASPFDIQTIKAQSFDALAFTSAIGVKYFFKHPESTDLAKGKLIFALEGKTRDVLFERGLIAEGVASSAGELAEVITGKPIKSVLHICGNLKLDDLREKLNEAGVAYHDTVVYHTSVLPKKVVESYDSVLFFSPSGVEGFTALNQLDDKTVYCCLGQTTAQALREKKNTANIIISQHPSPIAMLTAVADYWK